MLDKILSFLPFLAPIVQAISAAVRREPPPPVGNPKPPGWSAIDAEEDRAAGAAGAPAAGKEAP